MFTGMRLDRFDGRYTLSFDCDTPVDDVVMASGDEPNGHYWEAVAAFLAPELFEKLDPDSEGSMFSVDGKRRHVKKLQKLMEPVLMDPSRLRDVLARAHEAGVPIEG